MLSVCSCGPERAEIKILPVDSFPTEEPMQGGPRGRWVRSLGLSGTLRKWWNLSRQAVSLGSVGHGAACEGPVWSPGNFSRDQGVPGAHRALSHGEGRCQRERASGTLAQPCCHGDLGMRGCCLVPPLARRTRSNRCPNLYSSWQFSIRFLLWVSKHPWKMPLVHCCWFSYLRAKKRFTERMWPVGRQEHDVLVQSHPKSHPLSSYTFSQKPRWAHWFWQL